MRSIRNKHQQQQQILHLLQQQQLLREQFRHIDSFVKSHFEVESIMLADQILLTFRILNKSIASKILGQLPPSKNNSFGPKFD